jgi:hypothetical protein
MLAAPGLFLIDPLPPPPPRFNGAGGTVLSLYELRSFWPLLLLLRPGRKWSFLIGPGRLTLGLDWWDFGRNSRNGPGPVPCRHACVCVCVCVQTTSISTSLPFLWLVSHILPPSPIPSPALGSCVPLAPSLHAWDRSYIWTVGACTLRAARFISHFPHEFDRENSNKMIMAVSKN